MILFISCRKDEVARQLANLINSEEMVHTALM